MDSKGNGLLGSRLIFYKLQSLVKLSQSHFKILVFRLLNLETGSKRRCGRFQTLSARNDGEFASTIRCMQVTDRLINIPTLPLLENLEPVEKRIEKDMSNTSYRQTEQAELQNYSSNGYNETIALIQIYRHDSGLHSSGALETTTSIIRETARKSRINIVYLKKNAESDQRNRRG